MSFLVFNLGVFPQDKRLSVLPRVCSTERTQIPMAADSLEDLALTFTVFRTFFIHRQSLSARRLLRVCAAISTWRLLLKF